jgi:3-hydroxybutyryl-CoA dehydrogenase
MKIDDIQRILIVGAGTMGQQIGLQCAMYGYQVTIYDIDSDVLDTATAQIKTYAGQLVATGRLTETEAEAGLDRITTTTDPAEAAQADLLSESVPEEPELKAKVFAQFNQLCPPHTIFTTNTSTLLPSMFAEATGRAGQFVALHFHQVVWESNVVDIMPHPGTDPETVALLQAFAKRIGQIPIVLQKEHYGYVFNSMLSALNRAAISLAVNEVASIEDIDRAWMGVMKMPIGPMGILDLIGLKTAWDITDYWARMLNDPELQRNAAFLKSYVDRGQVGVKTGQGFYSYPDPAYQQPGFLEGE